jgi:hypothetical protein
LAARGALAAFAALGFTSDPSSNPHVRAKQSKATIFAHRGEAAPIK